MGTEQKNLTSDSIAKKSPETHFKRINTVKCLKVARRQQGARKAIHRRQGHNKSVFGRETH